MFEKIVNTFKHGDRRTKTFLGILLAIFVFALAAIVFSIALQDVLLVVFSTLTLLIDVLIFFNTDFKVEAVDNKEKEKKEQAAKEKAEKLGKIRSKDGADDEEDDEDRIPGRDGAAREKAAKEKAANPIAHYSEKELKKIMVSYKVKKEHVPVIVDSSDKLGIKECPAYVWKDKTFTYFLLLEEEPRMIKFGNVECSDMHIKRGVAVNPHEEYPFFREKSLVSTMFTPYLPSYHRVENGYKSEVRKNLYSPAPGVFCTAASVPNLLKLGRYNFIIDEAKINSPEINTYFRDVYVSRQLYRDQIFTANEYKEKVQEILRSLAESSVGEDQFGKYLAQMVQQGLIPQEYADYAITKRQNK